MAASRRIFAMLWFQRVFAGILRRNIGSTEPYLARWRYFVNKCPKLETLSASAKRLRFGTFITSSLVASRGIGFWSGKQSEDSEMADKEQSSSPAAAASSLSSSSSDTEITEEADRMYHSYKPLELYAFMVKHKDSENVDVLWRLCRACRDMAQMESTTPADKKNLTYEAMGYAEKCLKLDENNFASHKWFAICISEVGDYEGTKKKISNAYLIRDHFQKAIELNPKDATCHHLMGLWCFTFADMPWYQKKLATAIFGTPPSSTYEEALANFQKGEEVNPNFYSKNLLMLGRTYLKMGKKVEAKDFLQRTIGYPLNKDEDKQAVKEAEEHIRGL